MANCNQGARLSLREAKRWRNPDKILTPEPETFAKVYENRLDRQLLAMAALSARKMAEKERQNPQIAVHRASLDQPICIKRTYERILDANSLLATAKLTKILPESAEYNEVVDISLHPCVFRACREQLYASPDEHPYCFAPQTTARYQNATLLLADPLFQKLEAVLNSRHIPDDTTAGVAAKSGLLRTLSRPRRSPVEVQQEHQEFLRWWMAEGSWASIFSEPDRYDYRRLRPEQNKPTHLERHAAATLGSSKYFRPGALPASSKKLSETLPQIDLRIEPNRKPSFEALTEKTKKQIREAQADYQFPPSISVNLPRQQSASDNTFYPQETTSLKSNSLKSIASKSKQLLESRAMQILANTVEMLEARQEKIRQTYQITGVEPFTGRPTTETLPRTLPNFRPLPKSPVDTPTHPDFAKYLQNQRRLDQIEQKIQDAQLAPEPAEKLIQDSKPVNSSRLNPPILPPLSILPTSPTPAFPGRTAMKARALKLAENAASLLQIPHLNLQTILAQPRPANYQAIAPFFIAPLPTKQPIISFAESFAASFSRLALSWLDTLSPITATPPATLNPPLDAPPATNQPVSPTAFSESFATLSSKLLPKTSHETFLCKPSTHTILPSASPASLNQRPQNLPQVALPIAQLPQAIPQVPPTSAHTFPKPPNISPENLHAYPPSALISQLLNSPPSQQLLLACSLPHNILHIALNHYLHTLQHSEHADIKFGNTPIYSNLEVLSRLSYQPHLPASPGFPAQAASLQQALVWRPSKLFISTCRKLL